MTVIDIAQTSFLKGYHPNLKTLFFNEFKTIIRVVKFSLLSKSEFFFFQTTFKIKKFFDLILKIFQIFLIYHLYSRPHISN